VRAAIQASGDAGTALAERFGGAGDQKTIQWIVFPTNAQTIYKGLSLLFRQYDMLR
jgi:hypothetical protein